MSAVSSSLPERPAKCGRRCPHFIDKEMEAKATEHSRVEPQLEPSPEDFQSCPHSTGRTRAKPCVAPNSAGSEMNLRGIVGLFKSGSSRDRVTEAVALLTMKTPYIFMP